MNQLKNNEYSWTRTIPHDMALEIGQHRFSGEGWEDLQEQFDIYNKQFFKELLPKVLIIAGGRTDIIGGLCVGKTIFIARDDPFSMNCVLLHEMLHLENKLRNIYDFDHGISWVESQVAIHNALNINVNVYELSEDEGTIWPQVMFENYGINAYFKKCFEEHGGFKPLPSGWLLEKRVSPQCKGNAQLIGLSGCPGEDIIVLKEKFGAGYIESLLRRENAV